MRLRITSFTFFLYQLRKMFNSTFYKSLSTVDHQNPGWLDFDGLDVESFKIGGQLLNYVRQKRWMLRKIEFMISSWIAEENRKPLRLTLTQNWFYNLRLKCWKNSWTLVRFIKLVTWKKVNKYLLANKMSENGQIKISYWLNSICLLFSKWQVKWKGL